MGGGCGVVCVRWIRDSLVGNIYVCWLMVGNVHFSYCDGTQCLDVG